MLSGENTAPRGLQKRIACLYFDKYLAKYTTEPWKALRAGGHAMNLRRCAMQRRAHRTRTARRRVRSLWQCVVWIVDEMRLGRSCSRLEEWTSPARCSAGPLTAREAPSATWARCPGRVGTETELGSGRCSWCSLRNSPLYRPAEVPASLGKTRAPHRSRPSHRSCARFGPCCAISAGCWPPRVRKCWKSRSSS